MAWTDLFAGVAIYLILEGLLPFLSPGAWRRGLAAIAELNDRQLRTFGLIVMGAGLALLVGVRA